ncbi:uncharacterized protein LOC135809562 [Sycon ciliatum]|uniref:uncharacterized protein LOC135809562 n=1 Tax=Sycon ciliatum TaxID=27933 RepID=UPI0031F6150C
MSLLVKAGEAIRNSPLMARKPNYALAQEDETDPFSQGVTFYCEFMKAADLPPEAGRGDKENTAIVEDMYRNSKAPFRKYSVVVKDKSIRLKDVDSKQVIDEVPIHLISYCGSHLTLDRAFFLVYRHSQTNRMRAQLLRAADKPKAQAMVKTVSKAFSIAFGAWKAKQNAEKQASLAANKDSPRARRKLADQKTQPSTLSTGNTTGPTQEVTEKMGVITVTQPKAEDEESDDEFTALAASRSQPDLLANDVGADPKQFNWLETKAHVDPGSTSNLLDL